MTWGGLPTRTWERSSSNVTSRTQRSFVVGFAPLPQVAGGGLLCVHGIHGDNGPGNINIGQKRSYS